MFKMRFLNIFIQIKYDVCASGKIFLMKEQMQFYVLKVLNLSTDQMCLYFKVLHRQLPETPDLERQREL